MIIKDPLNDYKRYCPRESNGITNRIGQELLNESIEIYMHALLGAKAKNRQSIGGERASSLEVQQMFRDMVEDAVVQYSTSVWIDNMNESIEDTFLKLDMAVTPNTWLVPSSMILLKIPIEGYNNKLIVASTSGMKFGINKELNYTHPSRAQKKNPFPVYPVRQVHATSLGGLGG